MNLENKEQKHINKLGGLIMSVFLVLVVVFFFLFLSPKSLDEKKAELAEPEKDIQIQESKEELSDFFMERATSSPGAYVPAPIVQDDYVPVEEVIDLVDPAAKTLLGAHEWVPQTFNNCGPATASMLLQNFGLSVSQVEIKKALRTNPDDRNVFLYELSNYFQDEHNLETKMLFNGSIDTLKLLLANSFYVLTENWIHSYEDIGHFAIITGYDDAEKVVLLDDSFLGVNLKFGYEEFDELMWKAFNRTYILVYEKENEAILKQIIGSDWNETLMHQKAITQNMHLVKKNPKDYEALFNIGTSYYLLGQYQESWEAFKKAKEIGWTPRTLWYQIYPVQAANETGNYEAALELADEGLKDNNSFAELHYEKALSYQGLLDTVSAKKELDLSLKYDPDFKKAKEMLKIIP